ncbi:hypothetical protein LINPERHAP1_LOCUS9301, partial [Linum perenne]
GRPGVAGFGRSGRIKKKSVRIVSEIVNLIIQSLKLDTPASLSLDSLPLSRYSAG